MVTKVNEGSALFLTITFKDENGDNTISDQTKTHEERKVTIRADSGQVTQAFQDKVYRIHNLAGVT